MLNKIGIVGGGYIGGVLVQEIANRPELRLSMMFQEGDMQFLNNHAILHAREAFTDHENPDLKRHLLGKTSGRTEEELDLAILRDDGSLDPHLSAAIGEIYDDSASGALKKKD